jgi:hypothetical protein
VLVHVMTWELNTSPFPHTNGKYILTHTVSTHYHFWQVFVHVCNVSRVIPCFPPM